MGAENRIHASSGGYSVLVEESAEPIGSSHLGRVGVAEERPNAWFGRRPLAKGAVRSMGVVVRGVLGKDRLEMAPADDEHPVEAFASEGADDAFTYGVRSWGADRCLDDPDGLGGEHGVEGSGVLRVAVPDQELDRTRVLAELHTEVAGLLGHPVGDGLGGNAGDPHETSVVLDEDQHVESAKEHGVDVEEVAGNKPFRLCGEELAPCRP